MNLWQSCRAHIAWFGRPDDRGRQALEDAADYVGAYGVESTTALVDANPLDGIPAEADRVGAELLVLGTHFRKALLGKRFGSTVVATLKTTDRPVFITH